VLLVAQAGVPFTSGFIAKFGVIGAAVDESSYALAIIAMLSTVIAAFLYLRIMVSAWIQDAPAEDDTASVPIPFSTGLAITAAVVFTLVVGLYPEWLLDMADSTVQFAR
jgi:NADH-quinone oxidoreductase subunit N